MASGSVWLEYRLLAPSRPSTTKALCRVSRRESDSRVLSVSVDDDSNGRVGLPRLHRSPPLLTLEHRAIREEREAGSLKHNKSRATQRKTATHRVYTTYMLTYILLARVQPSLSARRLSACHCQYSLPSRASLQCCHVSRKLAASSIFSICRTSSLKGGKGGVWPSHLCL